MVKLRARFADRLGAMMPTESPILASLLAAGLMP